MPSRTVCAFLYCNNSAVNAPHLSYHRFPQNENSTDWIIRSGNDYLYQLTLKQLWDKRVCSEHFDKSAFMYGKRLRRDALPRMWTVEDAKKCGKTVNNTATTSDPANLPPKNAVEQESSKKLEPTLASLKKTMLNDSIDPESIEILEDELESISFMSNVESNTDTQHENSSGINVTLEKKNSSHIKCENDKKLLKQEIKKLKKQLAKADKMIESLRKTENGRRVTVDSVLEDSAKFLSPNQLLLLRMQLKRLMDEKEWTSWEKKFACSLYSASPDAYSFLLDHQGDILPRTTLVCKWVEELNPPTKTILSRSPYLRKGDIVVIPEKST